jgi:RecJ-like exonuclease
MRNCEDCTGYGKIMGIGMIYHPCDTCNGIGKIEEFEDSQKYKDAVLELQNKLSVSKEDAEKIFKEESDKIDDLKDASEKGNINVKKSRTAKNS